MNSGGVSLPGESMSLITTPAEYEAAKAYINESDAEVTWDLETKGTDWRKHPLCGIVLHSRERCYYLPFRHAEGPNLPEPLIQDVWNSILAPTRRQVLHHASFDFKTAIKEGYTPPVDGGFVDTIICALLLNENEDSFKLEELGMKYVDKAAGEQDTALVNYLHDRFGGPRDEVKQHLWRAPSGVVAPYGMMDGWNTHRLREFYRRHITRWKQDQLLAEYCDFQKDLCRIEMRGVLLDVKNLPRLKHQAETNAASALDKLEELAGKRINPNSSKQVCAWLKKKSSAKAVLKRMTDDPRAQAVLDARGWLKVTSTYYEPYANFADKDGVLRCNLHITTPGAKSAMRHEAKRNGTLTGRLSSSKPNLQQIPRESDTYRVKELFIARPGYMLAELDYSQAELRIAAHYSKDKKLTEILLAGADMHQVVAEEMNVPRAIAKNMNFSAWYGIGYKTFARNYYLPETQARDFLNRYHIMFTGIRRLSDACSSRATEKGYVKTYDGRLHHFNVPDRPIYAASNALIQGSVAAMVRRAMMRIERECPGVRIVLQVHDSVWLELPMATWREDLERCRAIMQDQPWCSMPMLVDAKGGRSLGGAESIPRSPCGVPAEALDRITDWKACGLPMAA
jgi:DNA polymerase-1